MTFSMLFKVISGQDMPQTELTWDSAALKGLASKTPIRVLTLAVGHLPTAKGAQERPDLGALTAGPQLPPSVYRRHGGVQEEDWLPRGAP